jgi:hypothetical protein
LNDKSFDLKFVLKRQMEPSLEMLEKMIDQCPDELWTKINGGFPFWQQLLHAYVGIEFWTNPTYVGFSEPNFGKDITSDLDKTCKDYLTKEKLKNYSKQIRIKLNNYFDELNSQKLLESSSIWDKYSYCDVILGQLRHIQYHVGHCNCILRQNNVEAVDWIDCKEL